MQTLNEYITIIENAIARSEITKEPRNLYAPINYTMDIGGKRLRPAMMLMTCEAFGTPYSQCLDQAIGLEYFHNFTLLHDDVMDNADMRRGKPTVHCKWDDNTAILSGDTMLTIASQYMFSGNHGTRIYRIAECFNRTAIEVYEGQQYDMDFENRTDVTVDEYMEMIRLKTSVLFGCACKIGAMIAGAKTAAQTSIYDFAVNLGLAFQLQDDYLDVYGDPATFGKEIGGDILNAKRTFMLISAYSAASAAQKQKLDELLDKSTSHTDAERIAGVTALYNALGIPTLCTDMINHYTAKAIESLKEIDFSCESFGAFVNLVESLMKRSR